MSKPDPKREPKGVPGGGRFASDTRTESTPPNLSMPAAPDIALEDLDLDHGDTYDVTDRFAGTGVSHAAIEKSYSTEGKPGYTLRTSVSIGDPMHHIPRSAYYNDDSDAVDRYVADRFGGSFDYDAASVDFETETYGEPGQPASVNALVDQAKANRKMSEAHESLEGGSLESFADGLKRYL